MLILTIVLLCILAIISYTIFERDVLAPPTVVSLGFVFAGFCAYYNEKTWGMEFGPETMGIIISGVGAFIVGSLLAIIVANVNNLHRVGLTHIISSSEPIIIDNWKTMLLIGVQAATIVMLYTEMRRLTGSVILTQMIGTYRIGTTRVDPDEITMRLSSMCSWGLRISFAIALLYSYVLGNNIAVKQKQPIINWIPIVFSSILSFMQGYRSDMVRFWVAILVVVFTIKNRDRGWQGGKEIRKMVKKMAISMVAIAVIFIGLRGIMGRSESDVTKTPIYYLTFYAGSSIAALDEFVKSPLSPSDIWGKETFYHLNQSIGARLGRSDLRYIFYKEFRRSPNGTYLGNIYTAIRPPLYDFGYYGMLLYMILMGLFFTFLYIKIRTPFGKNKVDFRLLLYSYIAYTFFMYFYNLYNNFLSTSFVKLVIALIIVRWFMIDIKTSKTRVEK